nr:MAG TPA: hypothetical protein [Bacteriophage sp.]
MVYTFFCLRVTSETLDTSMFFILRFTGYMFF